jgi:glycosyltransferase involved in cell wall biosynthesis
MKIAIVHELLTKIGGAEKVLIALHKIYPEAPIYTLLYDENGTGGRFSDCKIISSSLKKYPSFLRRKTKLFLPKLAQAIEEFDFSEYDTVISISSAYSHGILTKPSTFHICYCNSPMRYAWDWYHEYMKENRIGFGPKGLYIRNLLSNIRVWDKIASERVDFWISNSSNVKSRVEKYYQKDSVVICPPVEVENIEMSDNVSDDYYVIVSRLEPYKNIGLAVEAFNQNGKELVIIGTGSDENNLKEKANKNIEFLGWQSDKSVHEYMKNARAFIFPGEEDFGITPVESMACGRPVVALKRGGTLETIIDGRTGLFFKEETAESLNAAIDKLEKSYTDFIPSNCRKQAEKFSTENFEKKILSIVKTEYDKYQKRIYEN